MLADDAALVICPLANPIVVGGGFSGVVGTGNQHVTGSFPSSPGPTPLGSWTVQLQNDDDNWLAYADLLVVTGYAGRCHTS